MRNDASHDVRLQLYQSFYTVRPANDTSFAHTLLVANASNPMFAASQKAMDRNTEIKTYGSRLANVPAEDRKLILAGSNIFTSLCVTCHGQGGKGVVVAGTSNFAAPPLVESKRLSSTDKSIVVKILLHGLSGPVEGKEYPSVMPALGANTDEWVASVANYVRYEFGGAGRRFRRQGDTTSPYISLAEVAAIRNQNKSRTDLWTLDELEKGVTTASTKTNTDNASDKTVVGTSKTSTSSTKKTAAQTTATSKTVTYASVQPLLQKYTCLTCHNPNVKVIGPAYKDVAAKKYSVAKIVELIQKPNPANWPGYATRMPSMAHVPKGDITKIAQWIKSLEKAK
jgi:cytochrome c551/c552